MQVFSVSLFKIIALFDFTEKNMIYFVIIFFPFMMFIPFCKVLTFLPSNVYIWFVPLLMMP